jgi:predicted ATPase
MITSISAQNFKSWKDTGEVRLAPITGLFGSNSSGKTSLLQLLLMLKQTTESPDRSQVLHLGDDRSLAELGVFSDIVTDHVRDAALKFGVRWTLPKQLLIPDPERKGTPLFTGQELAFEAEVDENGSGRVSAKTFFYHFSDQKFGMKRKAKNNTYSLYPETASKGEKFHFTRTTGRPWELPAPVKCYGFPDQVKAYYQNSGFLPDFVLRFEELFSRVYYLGPLREYPKRQYVWAGAQPADMGQRGEKVIDALLASRERKQLIRRGRGIRSMTVEEYVAWWLRELKLIHSFEVTPVKEGSNLYQVWVQRSAGSAKVLITDVGFGVSQILPVVTLCYYVPEGATILMEQPEIHLHPMVQSGLADVFVDAVKKRNIQIILESHSEHLLKRLQLRIAEEQLTLSDMELYFCKMHGGRSSLERLNVNTFGEIGNWPEYFFGDDFGEMAAITRAKMQRLKRERAS